MTIGIKLTGLRLVKWQEYFVRFVLGGLATAMTGAIANHFGPETSGLFLAFPAIMCASATLIEKHERKRKEQAALSGTVRGKDAAALDAAGAELGSIGLITFAGCVWLLGDHLRFMALIVALFMWCSASVLLWRFRHALKRSPVKP